MMLNRMRMIRVYILPMAAVVISIVPAQADILSEARTFTADNRNTPTQNWEGPHVRELMTIKDWDKVLAESKKGPVFIFKHSTTCSISAGAAFRTNAWLKENSKKGSPKFYFLKVRERRPVSNKIEETLQVKHESPQLLLLVDGKHAWNTSHDRITGKAIEGAIEKYGKKTIGSRSE